MAALLYEEVFSSAWKIHPLVLLEMLPRVWEAFRLHPGIWEVLVLFVDGWKKS